MKGRPADPGRARRGTGHRPKPGEARPAKQSKAELVRAAVDIEARPVAEHEHWPPPATLPEQMHEVWRAAVDDLGGSGHMRASYLPPLEAYCEAIWLHAQAVAQVRESGLLVKGIADRSIVNPAVRVQKDAAATILRYADALGFTPSARIRMALEEVAGMSVLASLAASLDSAG